MEGYGSVQIYQGSQMRIQDPQKNTDPEHWLVPYLWERRALWPPPGYPRSDQS